MLTSEITRAGIDIHKQHIELIFFPQISSVYISGKSCIKCHEFIEFFVESLIEERDEP